MHLLGIILLLSGCQLFTLAVKDNDINISFIILSQDNNYHKKLTERKHLDILKQIEILGLNEENVNIYSTHGEFRGIVGYWTIFPLIERLSEYTKCSWFFFCEDFTHINVSRILTVLSRYNASHNVFGGHALKDKDPTIIHHFSPADTSAILYPYFASGFFLSYTLVKRLALFLKWPLSQNYAFSIDPKYEFAKFLRDGGTEVKLIHEPQLCISKQSDHCATWIENHNFICEENPVSLMTIFVAVKTCRKFHKNRISKVKNTWASEVRYLSFFSDVEDKSIPTIKLDVENVPNGHCEKTLQIMRHYTAKVNTNDWIIIVDDDTILSYRRLRKVLSCYDASHTIALGEKYGYNAANGLGYDYITGGGGMVFSMPAIRQIVKSCRCPSNDSPDDMILGMCLKNLGIPVIHSPLFHQARPIDYTSDFLKPFKHVSFHKHWMIDAYAVYRDWLQETETSTSEHHRTEL